MLKGIRFLLIIVPLFFTKSTAFAQIQAKDTLPAAIIETVHSWLRNQYIINLKKNGIIKDSADLIERIPFIDREINKEYSIIDKSNNLFIRYRVVLVYQRFVDDGFRTLILIDEGEKKLIARFDSLAQFNRLLPFLNKPLSNFDKSLLFFSLSKDFGPPKLIKRTRYRSVISKSVVISNEIIGSEIFGDYYISKGNKYLRQFRKYDGSELCFAVGLTYNERITCVKEANIPTYKIVTILFSKEGFIEKVSNQYIQINFKQKKIEYLKNNCTTTF